MREHVQIFFEFNIENNTKPKKNVLVPSLVLKARRGVFAEKEREFARMRMRRKIIYLHKKTRRSTQHTRSQANREKRRV